MALGAQAVTLRDGVGLLPSGVAVQSRQPWKENIMTVVPFSPPGLITASKLDSAHLRSLSARALSPWLFHALGDWAAIAAALAMIQLWPNLLTFVGGVLIVGNRQHALAILGHDGTHYTLSFNTRLNDFLTNLLCFWPLGLTVSGYRALHYAHHKNTGMPDDPELGHKRMRAPQWDLPATIRTVLRYAALDMVGFSVADYLIIVRFSKPGRRREYAPLVLFHAAFASVLLALGCWVAALAWYASLVASFMMFFRLRLWLEHQGTHDTQRIRLTWWQSLILAPHNAWHHWEHHKYPTIPYHRLPLARQKLSGPAILSLDVLIRALMESPHIASGSVPLSPEETAAAQVPEISIRAYLKA
jgi:fatty acid desaturase